MDNNYTDITIILDRSGSMEPVRMDTIGGLNSFIKEQQNVKGDKVLLSLIQFSIAHETTLNRVDIQSVKALTTNDYVPSGGTALLDAVGTAITNAGKRFDRMREDKRPAKVLFVIITDGEENSSHIYSLHQIKSMITEQQDKYKWQFVFLGANQDAFQSAASFGIYVYNASNYYNTSLGVASVYTSLSSNVAQVRSNTCDIVQNRSFFQTPIAGVDNSKSSGTFSNTNH